MTKFDDSLQKEMITAHKNMFENDKIIPSKLEVAPPPKCLSGVGDWRC